MADGLDNIDQTIRRLQKFAGPDGLERIVEKAIDRQADYMVELNRDQLEDGMRSDGSQLPPYSPATVEIKNAKGQQTQPMNLRDTGSWQGRLHVKKYDKYMEIISDDPKEGKLIERFGENIEGLTDENIDKVRDRAFDDIEAGARKMLNV